MASFFKQSSGGRREQQRRREEVQRVSTSNQFSIIKRTKIQKYFSSLLITGRGYPRFFYAFHKSNLMSSVIMFLKNMNGIFQVFKIVTSSSNNTGGNKKCFVWRRNFSLLLNPIPLQQEYKLLIKKSLRIITISRHPITADIVLHSLVYAGPCQTVRL